jgi:hypothetical protein
VNQAVDEAACKAVFDPDLEQGGNINVVLETAAAFGLRVRPTVGRDPALPRTGPAGVPWRIRHCPLIHPMKCYTKSLKSHAERVRPQFLSLRQLLIVETFSSAVVKGLKSLEIKAFAALDC